MMIMKVQREKQFFSPVLDLYVSGEDVAFLFESLFFCLNLRSVTEKEKFLQRGPQPYIDSL